MTDNDSTIVIIGIAGSLRQGSFNGALLRAAAQVASATTRVEIASIRGIPLYDGDVEAATGIPDVVQKLKDRIASSHGLLLATPQYNNSLPPAFTHPINCF